MSDKFTWREIIRLMQDKPELTITQVAVYAAYRSKGYAVDVATRAMTTEVFKNGKVRDHSGIDRESLYAFEHKVKTAWMKWGAQAV